MGTYPDALYLDLLEDLRPYISSRGLGTLQSGASIQFTSADIPPTPQYETVASVRLLESIFKKLKVATPEAAKQVAVDAFVKANDRCAKINASQGPGFLPEEDGHIGLSPMCPAIVDEAINVFTRWTTDATGSRITVSGTLDRISVGPGAAIGASGGSFYHKAFASTLTATSETLVEFYKLFVNARPSEIGIWRDAEEQRSNQFRPFQIVRGSRQSVVDKNVTTGRVICTEPSLNMMFQQGVSSQIEDILESEVHLNLATQQSFNRELAKKGSCDGSFSTIDLKSASDLISIRLVDAFCSGNPELKWLLHVLRSPETQIPGVGWAKLHMVSTMGNGFTFSLMTLILSALVISVYRYLGIPIRKNRGRFVGNFGVFGDDIIVTDKATRLMMDVLVYSGFLVNRDKSYVEGYFRESCGGDFYQGRPVKGVYVKTLNSPQDYVSLINGLIDWSARTGILLDRTVSRLLSARGFQTNSIPVVPPFDGSTAGIRAPLFVALALNSARYMVGPSGATVIRYNRYESLSAGYRVDDSFHPFRKRLFHVKRGYDLIYNQNGVIISSLQGCIRQGILSVRLDRIEYRYTFGQTPVWDLFPDEDWPLSTQPRMTDPTGAVTVNSSPQRFEAWEASCAYYLLWGR
jgi:hypothetical protein